MRKTPTIKQDFFEQKSDKIDLQKLDLLQPDTVDFEIQAQ